MNVKWWKEWTTEGRRRADFHFMPGKIGYPHQIGITSFLSA
jgi:hypothetical protein